LVRRKRKFLDSTSLWRWKRIRKYNKVVGKWLKLQLLVHITGGQPSQGEEINGLRLVNGIT
jgi:hypothetical protein